MATARNGLVACALYDKPVGIDIQEIFPYHVDIAQRICNEAELKEYALNNPPVLQFSIFMR